MRYCDCIGRFYWSHMIKADCVSTMWSIIIKHLIPTCMFTLTLLKPSDVYENDENGCTYFFLPTTAWIYLPFWILHNHLMTFLHHNDITSAKVNTGAPLSHRASWSTILNLITALLFSDHSNDCLLFVEFCSQHSLGWASLDS